MSESKPIQVGGKSATAAAPVSRKRPVDQTTSTTGKSKNMVSPTVRNNHAGGVGKTKTTPVSGVGGTATATPDTGHTAATAATKPPAAKRPTPDTGGLKAGSGGSQYKGLRHFSMMVCKKVEEKGTTTYNEVADELVAKVIEERKKEEPGGKFDEKNIRRRVYDALNVLMAMDIITKDKKSITWKGLPTSASQDLDLLGRERDFRRQEVEKKRQALQELLVQQVCFRNLVEHNREQQQRQQNDDASAQGGGGRGNTSDRKIPLPFIVVNTNSSAVIQCNMSRDLSDVMFDFNMPFEINDDNTILKRLGM